MKAKYFALLIVLNLSVRAFCQAPSPEFFAGLKLIATDRTEAKKNFLLALNKDPQFFGTYHFLGAIYMAANNLDSAKWYFNKAVALNTANINHTKELSYVRLINNYAYQHDFKNGFIVACEALKLYPENKQINSVASDLCLWSFYIKYDHLDPNYLSMATQSEYVVNNISQEYLILRKIRIDDDIPVVTHQAFRAKNEGNYDILTCTLPVSKKTITLNFKLNWGVKDLLGKIPATDPIISNNKSTVYEKVGAMLAADAIQAVDGKTDVKAVIEKLTN
ncbi:MAG: hypothetical protein V4560_11960 [Bacteroidota bacterium]